MSSPGYYANSTVLEEKIYRLIDIREQISREIAACRGRVNESRKRREDRENALQAEYNNIQQRIIELDAQMRANRSARTHTQFEEY